MQNVIISLQVPPLLLPVYIPQLRARYFKGGATLLTQALLPTPVAHPSFAATVRYGTAAHPALRGLVSL